MKKTAFLILLLMFFFGALKSAPLPIDTSTVARAALQAKAKNDSIVAKRVTDSIAAIKKASLNKTGVVPNLSCENCKWEGWAMIIFIFVAFLFAAVRSNLLRDSVTDPIALLLAAKSTRYANITNPADIPRCFSLSRSQLGLWTVTIACSYIYIELCRHCCFTPIAIDKNLLVLMGISAGTAAAGNLIDANNQTVPHHQDGPSDGFFADILSDQNGLSVHRFQNVVWTIIAVIIYLCQIDKIPCGSLPTLDSTLVSLTGISSLTYLGLKLNENKPPQNPVVPPAPPVPPIPPVPNDNV